MEVNRIFLVASQYLGHPKPSRDPNSTAPHLEKQHGLKVAAVEYIIRMEEFHVVYHREVCRSRGVNRPEMKLKRLGM